MLIREPYFSGARTIQLQWGRMALTFFSHISLIMERKPPKYTLLNIWISKYLLNIWEPLHPPAKLQRQALTKLTCPQAQLWGLAREGTTTWGSKAGVPVCWDLWETRTFSPFRGAIRKQILFSLRRVGSEGVNPGDTTVTCLRDSQPQLLLTFRLDDSLLWGLSCAMMLSRISDLYSLGTHSQLWQPKMSLDIARCLLWS